MSMLVTPLVANVPTQPEANKRRKTGRHGRSAEIKNIHQIRRYHGDAMRPFAIMASRAQWLGFTTILCGPPDRDVYLYKTSRHYSILLRLPAHDCPQICFTASGAHADGDGGVFLTGLSGHNRNIKLRIRISESPSFAYKNMVKQFR